MARIIVALALVACACAQAGARESRVVRTAQGPVRGYKNADGDIFHFYGIPYATAPTGTKRFTAPLPGPIWTQPFEAVRDNILCLQGKDPFENMDYTKFDMREDCLIANVYVPDTDETNLPVVVYVHGGAYQVGFGELSTTNGLVKTKKVIAITFNYRLGAHGFLCLGTEGAPGNAGMKDQVALLRWVQKNIANFGGNPNYVTIAGYSAGSSAVDLLMLSEMTKGLYNKVIAESGASIAPWSIQINPIQNAKKFAKQLNFTNVDDIYSLENFYTSLPFEELTSDTFFESTESYFVFSPCVERFSGVEKFLDDTPVNILSKGKYRKVPVLYGFANMEGLIRTPLFETWKDRMNEKFSDFLPIDLQFRNDEEREQVAQIIKEFYFGDKPVAVDTVQGYIDFFTDVLFAYPHLRSIQLQVEAGSDSIYLYEYSFFTPYPAKTHIPDYLLNIKGADHCAQTFAVLESKYFNPVGSVEFNKMRKKMIELWINFITTGKPVPEGSKFPAWPPVGENRSPHMELGEEIKLKGSLVEKRARFWDDIYERFYSSPKPPAHPKVRTEL